VSSPSAQVLLEVLGLKALPRAGWVRAGIPVPETVASHSWGVAWLVLVLLPDDLDRARALSYAVLHDLPEVRAGDITPHDGVSPDDKHAREHLAARQLLGPRPDLLATWEAYEAQADPEARFVRQLDRVDMALQAWRYTADHGHDLEEFVASAEAFVTHPRLRAVLRALRATPPTEHPPHTTG
jgi:putative hydrolase of HD superfamily